MIKRLFIVLVLLPVFLRAQDVPRDIWDTGFVQKRPARLRTTPKALSPATYRARSPEKVDTRLYSEAVAGVTIWRLRVAAPRDVDGARLLIQDSASGPKSEFVAERVDESSPLHEGDRIRIGIEIPRSGFLYVIDRERYLNGSTGQPVLLFPTLNMAQGANEVSPGRLIEIPPQNSSVKALRLTRSSRQHTGEDLLLIVSPTRLSEIVPTEGEQTLSSAQVECWEKRWTESTLKLSLIEPPNTLWSPLEQKAGAAEQPVLTQSDPLPQTILTVPPMDSTRVLLIRLPLAID